MTCRSRPRFPQSPDDADQYRASIAAGRLSIDDDALRSCADLIRSTYLGCDSLLSVLDTFATFSENASTVSARTAPRALSSRWGEHRRGVSRTVRTPRRR